MYSFGVKHMLHKNLSIHNKISSCITEVQNINLLQLFAYK